MQKHAMQTATGEFESMNKTRRRARMGQAKEALETGLEEIYVVKVGGHCSSRAKLTTPGGGRQQTYCEVYAHPTLTVPAPTICLITLSLIPFERNTYIS